MFLAVAVLGARRETSIDHRQFERCRSGSFAADQYAECSRIDIRRQGSDQFAIDEMLAAHLLDRQEAHNHAAGKPDQQLRADHQRKPLVNAARGDLEAQPAVQNQNLTPSTRLLFDMPSPAARAKRAVSPTLRSHDTPT